LVLICSLASILNSLPADTPPEFAVSLFRTLLDLASVNEDLHVLAPVLDNIQAHFDDWRVEGSLRDETVQQVAERQIQGGRPCVEDCFYHFAYDMMAHYSQFFFLCRSQAHRLLLSHLSTSSVADGTTASLLAKQLAVLSLSLPTFYAFPELARLQRLSVLASSEPDLWALLQAFFPPTAEQTSPAHFGALFAMLADGAKGAEVAKRNDLSVAELSRKAKVLALADLGSRHVGGKVSYADVAEALHLNGQDEEEIEGWVIEGKTRFACCH
jgi:hypothetical protein